jgi:hypothetical protein
MHAGGSIGVGRGCARAACRCAQEWEGGSSAFHAQRRRPWGRGGEAIADCTKGLRISPRAGDAVLFYSMAGAGTVAPPLPPARCLPVNGSLFDQDFLCEVCPGHEKSLRSLTGRARDQPLLEGRRARRPGLVSRWVPGESGHRRRRWRWRRCRCYGEASY